MADDQNDQDQNGLDSYLKSIERRLAFDRRLDEFLRACEGEGVDSKLMQEVLLERVLPKVPSPGLLMSIAVRLDHGLGMSGYYDNPIFRAAGRASHLRRLQWALMEARKVYSEVSGNGFYHAEREQHYVQLLRDAGLDLSSPKRPSEAQPSEAQPGEAQPSGANAAGA